MKLLALSLLLALGAAVPASERTIPADGMLPLTVNGTAGRMRVTPSGTSMPLLDGAFAARAGLRKGLFGVAYAVGPTRVRGATAVARLGWTGWTGKRRVAWSERPAVDGVDAMIGPGALPEPVVRFVLRPPRACEREVDLPLARIGGLAGRWGDLSAVIAVGGQPMRVRFDPHQPRTLATSAAGVRIAAAQGGRWAGVAEPVTIIFGVARPVRPMRLATPLPVGPLAVGTIGIRTGDYGSTNAIGEPGDPDEVVVIGKPGQPERDRITLGADQLARCSSLTFDKPRRVVRLACLPPGVD